MAILNSLLNMGESRLLGKVYLNDIDIGNDVTVANDLTVGDDITNNGTLSVGKSTAANAIIYLNDKLAIKGTDVWLRINETKAFTSGIYTGTSIVRSDSGFQVGDAGAYSILGTSGNIFKVPTTITYATTSSNKALTVNGDTNISGSMTAGTVNATEENIGELNVENANVYGTLRAAKYSIETVQNLGGHFLVCPTIEVPSDSTGFSCQVTKTSSTTLTIGFTDNSLSTDTFNGTTWTANSKVKVSGMINNVSLGTCNGTISSWNKTNKVVTVSVTCEADVADNFSTNVTSFTAAQVSNLSIMMYEVYTNNTTYPIGIYLTAYGRNKYSYIDVYGGTSATPVARMGKLDKNGVSDLPTVNGVTPTGWGFYAGGGSNGSGGGYFGGKLVSPTGIIGGFTIGSDAIYSSANALGTTANNVYIGTEGISLGTTFKVTKAGALTATSGKIANWRIEGTYLATGTATAPAENMLILSPNGTTSSYSVAGQNKTGWMITAGTTFGVNKDGGVYATSGKIGGWTVDATKIYSGTHSTWNSTAEDGLYLGNDGIAGGSGGIWYLWKDGSAKIGAMTLSAAGVLSVPAANITGTLSADRIGANTLAIGKLDTNAQNTITDAAKTSTNFIVADSNGIMVADMTGGVQTPSAPTSNNVLITEYGIVIRDKLEELATFEVDGATIGNINNTHLEMDYHSFVAKDNEDNKYFEIIDLRNEDGIATFTERFETNYDDGIYTLSVDAVNIVSITAELQEGVTMSYTFTPPRTVNIGSYLLAGDIVEIKYTTETEDAKAYTLGSRQETKPFGLRSTVIGINNVATGYCSLAAGQNNTASGKQSFVMGQSCEASGWVSFAGGFDSHADQSRAFAYGYRCFAFGYNSMAIGYNVTNLVNNSLVCGRWNDPTGTELFVVGNGSGAYDSATDTYNRSNAFGVYGNGNAYVSNTLKVGSTITAGSTKSYTATYSSKYASPNHCNIRVSAGICTINYMGPGTANRASGDTLFTLPAGCRPAYQITTPMVVNAVGYGTITIETSGVAKIGFVSNTTTNARIYFNCSFAVV